ncbi:MAG: FAD-dependent oxidoreductase [Thermoplasmata archaeon]
MAAASTESAAPVVILGAGYAGVTVAQEVARRSKGKLPIVLVDRHPSHVLRTELYEVGRMASEDGASSFSIPIEKVLARTSVSWKTDSVQAIDLAARVITLESGPLAYRYLAIGLGSVAAYYGVPGADQYTHQVYRLPNAIELAKEIREVERGSSKLPAERRPRIAVVGGGSTGTELAAEIATTDWAKLSDPNARAPEVVLLGGSLPFLSGFPTDLVAHARALLRRTGVLLFEGVNVAKIEPHKVYLEDGSLLAADVIIWCAGLQAPPIVRGLGVPHGKGGRIAVSETLEIPGHPGAYAVGDVVEFKDPDSGMWVPGTAQAAIAEARLAGRNIVHEWKGESKEPFRYKEKGAIVAVGLRRGAGKVGPISIWGSPAALVKHLVQREYARATERGTETQLL